MDYVRYADIAQCEWNRNIDRITGITFNYTAEKIAFDFKYSRNITANESFFVLENKRPVAAAEIFIETCGGCTQISWNGSYCLAPYIDVSLGYKVQERIAGKLMAYIDGIAAKHACRKIMLRADPLGNPGQDFAFYNYNYLLKHGYEDRSSLTQIIDLRRSKETLFSDIRKGHKSDIKKGRIYNIKIYNEHDVTDGMIELYKKIYEEDAGKVTRNSELYKHYFTFIKNSKGIIAFGSAKGREVGVAIVTIYKNTAYYSSYGELENELGNVPIGHILQWEIINYLKENGIEFYEIGEQVFGKTHYCEPDRKLINISSFKRGFGGYTVPFWRGMKELG